METRKVFTATVPSGSNISEAVNMGEFGLSAIYVPANMTSTAISFYSAEYQNDTFTEITKEDNTAYALTVSTTAKNYSPDFKYVYNRKFLKIKTSLQVKCSNVFIST